MKLDDLGDQLVAGMADALVVADAEGTIRLWNAGAERIFGFSAAEALGRSLDIIMPENLRQRHWDGYARTMRTGETRYGAGQLLVGPGAPQGRGADLGAVLDPALARPGRRPPGHRRGACATSPRTSRRASGCGASSRRAGALRRGDPRSDRRGRRPEGRLASVCTRSAR